MVFDLLFGRFRKKGEDPGIPLGRYSDNNKTVEKVARWTEADALFKRGEYLKSIQAFFDYLTDEEQGNVVIEGPDGHQTFTVFQGTAVIRGSIDGQTIGAETAIARMPEPSIPVMRRLLELNFNLYYNRCALHDDVLYMRFSSPLRTATPNKLYYGLKELATRADKHDDLLLGEFGFLQPIETAHVEPMSDQEKEVRYTYLQSWIRSTLDEISLLDPEKFAGGISYVLLALVFRIDYLITPEGRLLSDLEKIASAYYGKDDGSSTQRNPKMTEGFGKLLQKSREEVYAHLFRARYTFAIVVPHNLSLVVEAIDTALQNMVWYRDNGYPQIANKVMEYGFAFSQYSYSLPKPLSELFRIFMHVNYPEYFKALGFKTEFYDPTRNLFYDDAISDGINGIIETWKPKYASLAFNTKRLKFDTHLNFNQSFLQEVTELNFD